jgi:hypothetical protein
MLSIFYELCFLIFNMKKTLSILIAILFLYNIAGYLIVFKSFQYGIKKEIKSRIKNKINDKDLVLIKYPSHPNSQQKKALRWKEKNEFLFNGNMYDVVRQYSLNDTIYYYCINDTREKELFANLDLRVGQNMASNKVANNLVKLFKLSIDQSYLFNFSIDNLLRTSKATVSLYLIPGYAPVQKEVETPPPELA